jgi:hypothetical protein
MGVSLADPSGCWGATVQLARERSMSVLASRKRGSQLTLTDLTTLWILRMRRFVSDRQGRSL